MRIACLLIVLSAYFVVPPLPTNAQTSSVLPREDESVQFPYQALVAKEGTLVHSGPAEVHYPTQQLSQGEMVEVHRHDPGGWCAIRPPTDSFSMVPESTVQLLGDKVGQMIAPDVQAWVGTRLGTVAKPLWQVKLKRDEEIRILGEVSWPEASGNSVIWYQIAPPAGEFRWVKREELQIPNDQLDTPKQAKQNNSEADVAPAVSRIESGSTNKARNEIQLAMFQTKAERINDGWKRATRPIRVANNQPPTRHSFPIEDAKARFQVPAIPVASHSDHSGGNIASTTSNAEESVSLNREQLISQFNTRQIDAMPTGTLKIAQLNQALSREMIKPAETWQFGRLETQANELAQNGSLSEKTLARRILEKIQDSKALQRRVAAATGIEIPAEASELDRKPNAAVGSGIAPEVEFGTTYDAFGYLNELVRNGGTRQSTFVLQDENGKITHHVTGVPGLNLHRYKKQKVGIIGQRGYHRQLKLDHVTADRVIVLSQLR